MENFTRFDFQMIRIKIKYPTLSKRVSRLKERETGYGLARAPTEDPTDWVSGMFLITTSSGATRHTGNTITTTITIHHQTQSMGRRMSAKKYIVLEEDQVYHSRN